jgi:hypothetical protein
MLGFHCFTLHLYVRIAKYPIAISEVRNMRKIRDRVREMFLSNDSIMMMR